jgi:hypothetical protein
MSDNETVYNNQCDKCGKECEKDDWFICGGDCGELFCNDCDKKQNPHPSGKCNKCETILFNRKVYQVRAYASHYNKTMNETFISEISTDYQDLETAMEIYETAKDLWENISLTETPFLVEDEYNDLCEYMGVDKKYEIKYIATRGLNKQ